MLWAWASRPGDGAGKVRIIVFSPAGSALADARQLAELGLTQKPLLFALYLRLARPAPVLQPGEHLLPGGLSPKQLVRYLARAPTRPRRRVTLPEGFNLFQIARRLQEQNICPRATFLQKSEDAVLLQRLKVQSASVEGYLFPSTYELFENARAEAVIEQLTGEMRKRLVKLDERHKGGLTRLYRRRNWGEKQVLTLASLVEKEAQAVAEQKLIASVFYNRLDDPDFLPARRLQSDPTAAYGCLQHRDLIPSCRGYTTKVLPGMLRDPRNPYNTYVHPGLPPGPIANPGESAISAVIEPAKTDFLFFVSDGKGRHTFSRSFEEHNQAVTQRRQPAARSQKR